MFTRILNITLKASTASLFLAPLAANAGVQPETHEHREHGKTEAQPEAHDHPSMAPAEAAEEAAVAEEEEKPAQAPPEARLYDASIDASQEVGVALARAASSGKHVMIVMGANWCSDSRAFAGWTQTPRFKKLIDQYYELVFINVGRPQTGDGHNLHIARRFGIEKLDGIPTVLILSPAGKPLNADTATTWRNAERRSEDEIYDELAGFVGE